MNFNFGGDIIPIDQNLIEIISTQDWRDLVNNSTIDRYDTDEIPFKVRQSRHYLNREEHDQLRQFVFHKIRELQS